MIITIDNKKKNLIEEIIGSKAKIKILKTLAINKELTISLIISKTKLNHSNVVKHLNSLITYGLIQEKKFGRIKIYRYKTENIKARSLKNLIELWESDF
ncbi:MAG: ArsR family transcriptional regulator [Promethearchaeota archaeon]